MNFLEIFYLKTLKYDLLNKFFYKKTKQFPKLKKLILNFRCDNNNFKALSKILLALQLISYQKSKFTTSKQSNLVLKIRKGDPVGCKVTLRKNLMFQTLFKLLIEIFPKTKNFTELQLNKQYNWNVFSYTIKDVLIFSELEKYYHFFNTLPKLKMSLVTTNTKTKEELLFLLISVKIPITNKVANITQLVEYNLAKIKVKSSNLFICFG